MAHIGERIAYLREQLGMAPVRLARMAQTSRSNLSKIEAGKSRPSAELLRRIAAALGVTPNDLLLDQPPPSREEQIARVRGVAHESSASPDPSLLRHRPGYAALLADVALRRELGITDQDLEALGRWGVPLEDMEGTKQELIDLWFAVKDRLRRLPRHEQA